MSQANRTVSSRRINLRAALIMGIGGFVVVSGLFVYKAHRATSNRALFLQEAKKRLDANRPDLALQYLNQYLVGNSGDADALDLKAKILADSVGNSLQALEAMPIHNQVLGIDPENPKRQDTRRRLVELNLMVGGRAKAAEALARDLIQRGASDASAHRLLARALESEGADGNVKALEEASQEYEAAERIEPGNVDGAERLARLYRDKLNDSEKALEVLDRLLDVNRKSGSSRAAALLARARFFLDSGEAERADRELAEALNVDPSAVEVRIAAADAANRRGDLVSAKAHVAAIAETSRNDLRVKLVEGLIELSEQRPDAAVESWRDGLLQSGGNSAELTWRLAQVLLDMGRTDDADPLIAQYRRLIGGDEPNLYYRYLNGFSLFKKGRTGEAVKALEAIRYKAPRSLEGHLNYVLGQCYEQSNDTLKAVDAYRQATKSNPTWSTPRLAIANLEAAERLGDAYRTIEQGLAITPNDPRLLVNSALLLWRQQCEIPAEKRSWSEFEQVLERAEKADPKALETVLLRADYLTVLGKTETALERLETAIQGQPQSAPLWLALANLLNRTGRTKEAIETLDRAMTKSAQANFVVLRASYLLAQDRAKEARNSLLEGLNQVPPDQRPQLWRSVGELALKQGDRASARDAFGQWAKLQPDRPEPRAALLELALSTGDATAIRAEVEALKGIGGPQAPYWRLARIEELLHDRGSTSSQEPGTGSYEARFNEAATLIREVESNQPYSPSGYLAEGRLAEKRGQIDQAISAYEKALKLKGGTVALGPLMALLVREHRDDDLERIRRSVPSIPIELERLATVQALKAGDKDRAEQLAAKMVEGDPQGLDARIWQARVLNELGKPNEAESTLRLLIEAHPNDATPWLQLLMLQVSQRKLKDAAATVEQIRGQVKSDRPELLWAQCYRVVNNLERSETYYRAALKRWPDDLVVHSAAVAFFEQAGRPAEAEASLRHLLKLDPSLSWASRQLALLLASRDGDLEAWNEALQRVGPSDRADDTPEDRLARARVLARSVNPRFRQQAIEILEALSKERPDATGVHEQLARLLRDVGQIDQARAAAMRAAGDGASPEAILLYAGILLNAQAFDDAQRQLDRLDALDPDSLALAELRARVLVAQGESQKAATCLEQAFLAHLESPEAQSIGERMIGLLLQLKLPDTAESIARRVGKLGPRGLCTEGLFLAGRGRFDEAAARFDDAAKTGDLDQAGTSALILASAPGAEVRWLALADRYFSQALDRNPSAPDLLQKLARVRFLQGRFEEQIKLYREMIALKPTDLTFLNDMAWTLSEDLNQPEKGLEQINELLARSGVQANALDTRGVILTRLGRLDEAVKDLEASVSSQPTGPSYYHLARAYHKQGLASQFEKARQLARKARLRPDELQPSERAEWALIMER